MKLLATAPFLLLNALPISARALNFFDTQSPIRVESLPVNGENPLEYCADPSAHLLQIEKVDLHPNPPLPGQTLSIKANGTLLDTVEEGAIVLLEVKYGLITLLKQQVDLCEQVKNVDIECPLEKGDLTLSKDVDLPKEIPPGKYSVLADVYTNDQRQITCLRATNIEFRRF
ncbi:Phosphatidylglycerol/phosphatidylinositol transfer protein [Monascus purpureus]|uniref:Phosphatidylglycerol/phosphatidylinositol transfer protein n=1 Tax=Monascus purpureus TaxID=5098 RepID=A0A507QTF9_MONPU|nr:Phosphatidylglycerol/phosphatidylinositol transfer protein [Monascus purpureus]BDD56123.1 phosphatidylglycerol/phosphatidylinositol transfer protein [Monascus purpureus]